MTIGQILARKRDGEELTAEEIGFFVRGVVDGTVHDYQASAWLMAVFIRGMSRRETRDLPLLRLGGEPGMRASAAQANRVTPTFRGPAAPRCPPGELEPWRRPVVARAGNPPGLAVLINDLGLILALPKLDGTEIEEFDPGKPDRIARIKRIIRLRNRNRRDSPAGLMRLPHVTAQSGERQLMLRFSIRRILYCALRRDSAAIARIRFPDTAEIPLGRRR